MGRQACNLQDNESKIAFMDVVEQRDGRTVGWTVQQHRKYLLLQPAGVSYCGLLWLTS